MILRLEIESGGETEILVRRPRVAINATVLATAIRIDARLESDVRTVVARDEGLRGIAKVLRGPAAGRSLVSKYRHRQDPSRQDIEMKLLEPIGRAPGSAAAVIASWLCGSSSITGTNFRLAIVNVRMNISNCPDWILPVAGGM